MGSSRKQVEMFLNRKGQIEVHQPGCADIARKVSLAGTGGGTWTAEVGSQQEAIEDAWADQLAEASDEGRGYGESWEDYLGETTFAPCVGHLPLAASAG